MNGHTPKMTPEGIGAANEEKPAIQPYLLGVPCGETAMGQMGRLHAADPELLDLVRRAYDRFTDNDMMPPNHALAVWLEQARAAIAKAERVRE